MTQKESINLHAIFSPVAHAYSRYRPSYPPELFSYLASLPAVRTRAWDCGTGNGQAALALAQHFEQVSACDVSPEQIALAKAHPRVQYLVRGAERSDLDTASVDLVTVAEALHWFDIQAFFLEVSRVLRPSGVLAVWNYGRCVIEPEIDKLLDHFKDQLLEPYWPTAAREANVTVYAIPFCYEVSVPKMEISAYWDVEHIIGYLGSWSATAAYRQSNDLDPVDAIHSDLVELWGDPGMLRCIRWPLNIRAGYF